METPHTATPQDPAADVDRIVGLAFTTHASGLRRHLAVTTRDGSAAEDLTQEAFLRLTVEVRAGRVPEDVGAWLHRVGRNLAASRGRRLSVADRHRAHLVERSVGVSPEQHAIDVEEQRAVCAALDGLGSTDRRALVLAANGYRGPEIARSLGRSDCATRTLLCRARARVRAHLLPIQAAARAAEEGLLASGERPGAAPQSGSDTL